MRAGDGLEKSARVWSLDYICSQSFLTFPSMSHMENENTYGTLGCNTLFSLGHPWHILIHCSTMKARLLGSIAMGNGESVKILKLGNNMIRFTF